MGAEGIEMGTGVGFFAEVGSGATVCRSSITPFPNESFSRLLSGMTTQDLGYSLIVGLYAVCKCSEIESRDGEVPRQVVDHFPLHQVDVAELVETVTDDGLALEQKH